MNEPFTTAVPPPPMPVSTAQRSRSLQIALFVAATLWFLYVRILAANAANSLGVRYDLGDAQPLIEALLLLLLLLCGLVSLRAIEGRLAPLRQTLGLPKRETSLAEWGLGAAIGWGLAVAAVVPMALARTLNTELWTAPRAYSLVGFSLLTLAVTTLAYTLALFGYGFQRLIEAAGPTRATLILAALTAIHGALTTSPTGTPETTRILIEVLAAVLLALGWMRTHGLWLIWGLSFAWAASTGVLFGLPLGGSNSFASLVDTRAVGPLWLTGGVYGPAAAIFSVVLLIAAIPTLIHATDEYAWQYTRPPLIPAGVAVTIAPPAAHSAMEEAAPVAGATLVQILPSTPQGVSADVAPK